jgi:UDPglucose--hexose-1-phosphate uridylyltransferase
MEGATGELPEYRCDPVTGRWVIIAPSRANRPHEFVETVRPTRTGTCPFCPGSEHETPGEVAALRCPGTPANQPGWQVRIVPNKFPAVVQGEAAHGGPAVARIDHPKTETTSNARAARPAVGRHEVVIETDVHAVAAGEIPSATWLAMWRLVRDRFRMLGRTPGVRYVQWFKNVGDAAGASIEHAHGQIIAVDRVPEVPAAEMAGAGAHFARTNRCIYCEIVMRETAEQTRLVELTSTHAAWCNYAGRFSYEMVLAPRKHAADFAAQSDSDLDAAATLLQRTLARLERICPVPAYNIVLHTAPIGGESPTAASRESPSFDSSPADYYHWHWEILPRLTKAAGFEWGAGIHLNPVAPEQAAQTLRNAKPD